MGNPVTIIVEMPEGLEEIVPEYLNSQKKDVGYLTELLATGQFDGIRRVAHNLKGNGTAFGFPELTRFGTDMDRFAQEANMLALSEQLRNLAEYLDRVQLR